MPEYQMPNAESNRRRRSAFVALARSVAYLFETQVPSSHDATLDRTLSSIEHRLRLLQRDITAIRDGKTGADKQLRADPLTPTKRLQVEQVKARYYEKRELNPGCSLLSITRQVFEDGRRQGLTDGFNSLQGLNARAVREIKREDNGLPAF